ncbi:MAG TPA: PEP-CTERM sorting domain-containing protein [Burkholderiaceae bacterium]|jgi:hypothetical protein
MYRNLVAAAVLMALAAAAQANVTAGIANQNSTSFLDLSSASSGITVSGGALYNTNTNGLPSAAIPTDVASSTASIGEWLGVGPNNGTGGDAVLSFTSPVSYVSFLWGSPDSYNTLTVTTNLGTYNFQSSNLTGLVYDGNQSYASYVGFTASAGESITSLTFSSGGNAFEASNFSVTSPVPEPESYALLMAGLFAIGLFRRRRAAR